MRFNLLIVPHTQGKSAETLALMRRIPCGSSPGAASDAGMGLQAIYQAPRTTTRHPEHRVYPYLLKGLAIERPNQVWSTDIERHEAFSNLAVVTDHRRQPVAAG